jgi:hypothetical protein
MKNYSRILIAIGIFLVGAALIPFVGLPQDGFSWQRFADAYLPMTLEINCDAGQQGSVFSVNGYNFPEDEMISFLLNGTFLGSIATNSDGDLMFWMDSSGADTGFYTLTTSMIDGPQVSFRIRDNAPLCQGEGTPTFPIPSGIALQLVHLPFINK